MKAVSEFFPRMLPYLPGCPEPTAAQALVDAAIVFCEDSMVLREDLDPFTTVAGQSAYELDVPSQQQIARIMRVLIDGREVPVVLSEDVVPNVTATAQPTTAYTTRNGSLLVFNLFPTPDKAYEVKVQAAMRPTKNAKQFEDDLFNLWSDAVIAGAMARCMMIPGQPFSNPAEGSMYSMTASTLSRRARVEGNFGRVQGNMRVKGRPFA